MLASRVAIEDGPSDELLPGGSLRGLQMTQCSFHFLIGTHGKDQRTILREWHQLSILDTLKFDVALGMPKTSRNPIDDFVT